MNNIIDVKKNNIKFQAYSQEIIDDVMKWNFWQDGFDTWEPETFNIFDIFLNKEKDFLDIGAWVGPTSIYGSFISKNVISVEPDPVAFNFLLNNVKLNNIENIILINKALSEEVSLFLNPKYCLGSSMSVVSNNLSEGGVEVDGIWINELLSMGDYSLIKIDIEGYEEYSIPRYINSILDIPLYLSIHTPFYSNIEDLKKALSLYNFIYDDKLNEVSIDQIFSSDFPSFLFLPKSIDEYR
jgi:FkbM family methyltransferase